MLYKPGNFPILFGKDKSENRKYNKLANFPVLFENG
jgi:hypothetical protein